MFGLTFRLRIVPSNRRQSKIFKYFQPFHIYMLQKQTTTNMNDSSATCCQFCNSFFSIFMYIRWLIVHEVSKSWVFYLRIIFFFSLSNMRGRHLAAINSRYLAHERHLQSMNNDLTLRPMIDFLFTMKKGVWENVETVTMSWLTTTEKRSGRKVSTRTLAPRTKPASWHCSTNRW